MTRLSWAVIAVLGLVSLQQLHAMESEESVDVVEGGGVISNGEEWDLDLGRVGGVTAARARRGRAGEAAG